MKQYLTVLLLLVINHHTFSQDLIIKKDNTADKGKIIEVTSSTVRYKSQENLNGPEYNIDIEEILAIVYENGHWQSFYQSDDATVIQIEEDEKSGKQKDSENGRRPLRQLGYNLLYRESTTGFDNANRYGINYSMGHIKDDWPVGFLFEIGFSLFKQGLYDEDEKVLDNYNLMMTTLIGVIVKLYKSEKFLAYSKVAVGGVASSSFIKEPEEFFSYNTIKLDYNYNLTAGVNYKLTKKFGLYAEGGYSRIQFAQAGISFMID